MTVRRTFKTVTLALSIAVGLVAHAKTSHAQDLETLTVAGGCFWCVEADFEKVEGQESKPLSPEQKGESEVISEDDLTKMMEEHIEEELKKMKAGVVQSSVTEDDLEAAKETTRKVMEDIMDQLETQEVEEAMTKEIEATEKEIAKLEKQAKEMVEKIKATEVNNAEVDTVKTRRETQRKLSNAERVKIGDDLVADYWKLPELVEKIQSYEGHYQPIPIPEHDTSDENSLYNWEDGRLLAEAAKVRKRVVELKGRLCRAL